MALFVKRPVILKNIVTKEFKDRLVDELGQALDQIDRWFEQEEFQSRRLISEAEKQGNSDVVRKELNIERDRQGQIRLDLKRKLDEIIQLDIGSVFTSGTYDAPVKIEVGDNIRSKLAQAEIIVKDGVVVQVIE
ncbi:hypothetical protein CMK13_16680 [Candidatus Poribacteria bacterium]|nr:hypothetical protein [Candidatus Poribacteria bacterium]MCH2576467.1 YlqD family protein [Candidatus Poribacteria bacterium]OUT56289.1 MAG: hypothetical protein CBB75_16045 [bacterium TMED15]|tara:strand:+ start:184 stop:585 length:402 start_codon:yes stop_codon:yes gene_type:complete